MSDLLRDEIWDSANGRFRVPSRCPNPECGQPVAAANVAAALAWCAACEQPYEVVKARLQENQTPFEIHRRARIGYCTYTGEELRGYSRLDWSEVGGGPGRCNSLDDPAGLVFGRPDPWQRVWLAEAEGWCGESILEEPDPSDWVAALAVARGVVVAVTARGRVGLLDAVTGRASRPKTVLDWPGGLADSGTWTRAVTHAPAIRGTNMLLAVAEQAVVRDLRPYLLGHASNSAEHCSLDPGFGRFFLGPPLGVDTRPDPCFCLLEGRTGDRRIDDAVLRFVTTSGEDLGICPCPDIARPPVYDRATDHVVWVTTRGEIHVLEAAHLGDGNLEARKTFMPNPPIDVETTDKPLFLVSTDAGLQATRSELWLTGRRGGEVVLYHAKLDDLLADPSRSWSWSMRDLGQLGDLRGLAVGLGSRRPDNAAGHLLAVTTDERALLYDRTDNLLENAPIPHGSYDPPVICSAGAVTRCRDGYLRLDNQEIGWSTEGGELHPRVAVEGGYEGPQGIAMFGRRIYVGQGTRVLCFQIRVASVDGEEGPA